VALISCPTEAELFFPELLKTNENYQRFFIHQINAFKRILKFTLKQLRHVSVQSPSSGSVLFELAKVTVVKIAN
jgi:hypothetical protein